ncbi:S-protein homolog 1 [Linum grandiflorum]
MQPFWTYTHVHVINELSKSKPLLVHCKSKDDDMGIHWVGPNGEYEWRFKPKIFGNTLFWCHVKKRDKEIVYKAYWEDNHDNDRQYMDHVRWVAKEDGLYLRQFWKGVDVFWQPWP